jgi:hypothetical protein
MIDFHPVAAAPGVPSRCSHHTRICRVDTRSTGGREVLAPVEFAGFTGEGVVPQSKGGTRVKHLKGCHEEARSRPPQSGGCDTWGLSFGLADNGSILGGGLHGGPAEGYFCNQIRYRATHGVPLGREVWVKQRRAHDAGRRNHPDRSLVERTYRSLHLVGGCLKSECEDGKTYDNCRREAPQSNPAGAVGPRCMLVSPMSCHRILLV